MEGPRRVNPGELLRIFSDIADEHSRPASPSDPLRVLSIITDELAFRSALVEEFSLALGGVVLDLTGADFAVPVAGRDQASLRGDVLTSLAYTDARGIDHGISLEFAGGVVDASLLINGLSTAAGSRSQEQFLSLGRALFSAELDDAELAVVRYSEAVFDPDAASAVWRLLHGFAGRTALRLGGVRTLVLLVQASSFSVARHVGPNGGARFVQTLESAGRRKPPGYTRQVAGRLATQRTPPLVMFLGAGFSVSSGLPTGNALRDSAIRRLLNLPDPDDGRTSSDLASEFVQWAASLSSDVGALVRPGDARTPERVIAELTLEQVSRIDARYSGATIPPAVEEFRELHDERLASPVALGRAVLGLRALARRHPRLVLVTVNFDELLEHAEPDLFDRAVTDVQFEAIMPRLREMMEGRDHPDHRVPLLKLHGTIGQLPTCVADEETVRLGISRKKRDALLSLMPAIPPDVRTVEEGRKTRWIYVGASMRDADLNPTVLQTSEFNLGVDEWWVAPLLEPSVQAFFNDCARNWAHGSTLDDRFVTDTADTFVADLVAAWP